MSQAIKQPETDGVTDRVVSISRVTKVVKGGRRFSFSALVVAGDGKGSVGYGLGKAQEVPEAIRKATQKARRRMVRIPVVNDTIPHDILGKFGSARVVLRAAGPGTGVIAGGVVRAIVESAGVQNILSKCIGTTNPHNVVKATFQGLGNLQTKGIPEEKLLGYVDETSDENVADEGKEDQVEQSSASSESNETQEQAQS